MTALAKDLRLHRGRGPQGLRRLRFSFFLFTCQTAREQGCPHPSENRRADEASSSENCRMAFHCSSEELQRRVIAAKRGGRRRWVVYRRRLDPLSTAKFERFAAEISCRLSHEESREPQHKHILSGEGPNCNAVEKPYSCDLLAIELIRGVIAWGGARSSPLPIVRLRQPLSLRH